MSIERELLNDWMATTYQEPEVQLAAGPAETVTDAGPAFTMPGMGKRRYKSEAGQNLPLLAADAAAGAGKGLVSGVLGFAGDIESLYQGVKGIITRGGDETALQGFLRGMADKTIAPTSDEVSKWLDANVGPVVPPNASTGSDLQKYREAAASGGEFAGQLFADPFAAVKGGKIVAQGAKALAPKAAEMVIKATEKTGVPVRGLGIVESGAEGVAKATAPASDIGFFSAVEQAALNIKRNSGTGQAMLNDITKGENVKADEIKWIGLDDFLKGKKNVTREEVQQFIAQNKVDVQEVTLGGDFKPMTDPQEAINYLAKQKGITPDQLVEDYGYIDPNDYVTLANDVAQPVPTKFKTWTLPGGENYREILLTLPSKPQELPDGFSVNSYSVNGQTRYGVYDSNGQRYGSGETKEQAIQRYSDLHQNQQYKSSHWEQPNVLAHIRVNDRVDADGKKMLLVEEVQSDWHQAGRDKGYGPKTETTVEAYYLSDSGRRISLGYGRTQEEAAAAVDPGWKGLVDVKFDSQTKTVGEGVPDAPMKDTWYQLALKRVLKYAADNGYERVGLTTGSRQAERYDLSKQISEVHYSGTNFVAYDKNGDQVIQRTGVQESDLPDLIGKEAAKKLLDQPKQGTLRSLSGQDLQVGGEGMKKYYDEVYPQFLAKYGKKWGAKVGETTIPTDRSRDASGIPSMYPNKEPVRYIDITPSMKESVSKGQPLFSATGLATGAGAGTMATSQQEPQ